MCNHNPLYHFLKDVKLLIWKSDWFVVELNIQYVLWYIFIMASKAECPSGYQLWSEMHLNCSGSLDYYRPGTFSDLSVKTQVFKSGSDVKKKRKQIKGLK